MSDTLVVKVVTIDDVKKVVELFSSAIDFLGTFLPDGNIKKLIEFLKELAKQDWLLELLVVIVNAFNKSELVVRDDVVRVLNGMPAVV